MSKVKILFLNVNGLIGKTNWLFEYRKNNNIDLLCMVETWLSPPDSCPFKRNIIADIRNPRTSGKRSTGGILVVSSSRLRKYVQILEVDPERNYCVLRLFKNTQIIVCYFPPRPELNDPFRQCLAKMATTALDQDVLLIGDLNGNLNDPNANRKRDDARGSILREWLRDNKEDK